ncbi:MAG: WG repeat-containing protein [Clostridia bacterium]|nr:WG repeat-containing protein [Clostridia bacterium]
MNEDLVRYVNAAAQGSTDAMAKLYSLTLKSSFYLAFRLSGNVDEALDITKNAYTRVFCTIPRLKKPDAFEIYMRQNIAAVYKEGRKFTFGDAVGEMPESSLEFLSEDVYEDPDKTAAALASVANLSDELRSAVVLHYFSGMPVAPLARYLNVSESTVNSVLAKAKNIIFEQCGSSEPGLESAGKLPVLNRIFKREAETVRLHPDDVRDMFAYIMSKYQTFKEVETAKNPGPASSGGFFGSSSGEPQIPDRGEKTRGENGDEIDFDRFVDSPVNRPAPGGKKFGIDTVKSFIANFDIRKDWKKLLIVLAALIVLILIISGIAKAASKGKNTGTVSPQSSSSDVVNVEANWMDSGLQDCTEIYYLNEYMCGFKSITTQKYGLLDYQGNILIQPVYDEPFKPCGIGRDYTGSNKYHVVIQIDKVDYYVTYSNGRAEIAGVHQSHSVENDPFPEDAKYDERDRYFEGYAAAEKNGKWGYIDRDGKRVINYQYEPVNITSDTNLNNLSKYNSDYCRPVTGGLIAVKKDGLMGIVNLKNDTIADFQFTMIMPGKDGVFIAQKDGKWGFIVTGSAAGTFKPGYLLDTSGDDVSTDPSGVDKYYIVTGSGGINVRADADKDSAKVGELQTGSRVKSYGTKTAADGKLWLKVEYNGQFGFISMNLVREDTNS